jgi:ADP-ribose pyrophosphatase YjhB (NUDIX family)
VLRLIPRALHRAALNAAHEARKLWWRLARPRVEGVRVVALDGRGHVLLVRHGYGSRHWMTPGGGLRRGEDPLLAASRELREECGCGLIDARLLAVVEEDLFGATNVVHVIGGRLDGAPHGDGREVLACALFPADGLPPDLPQRLRGPLPGWVSQQA